MYLISIYFDKKTNKTLQWYIDKIAEKTGNHFMIENRVPPHMTIAAIEARNVDVLKSSFDDLNGKLYAGSMKIVSIGQLFPYVMYATPKLDPVSRTQCIFLGQLFKQPKLMVSYL